MKIIFLDIDGVINLDSGWCVESISTLNKLIQITKAELVLSSDWRYEYSLAELNNIFKNANIEGIILDSIELISKTNISTIEKDRVLSIMNFIRKNETKEYLVIDDMDLSLCGIPIDKFVKTKASIGLKEKGLLDKCLSILRNNNKPAPNSA